MFKFGTIGAFKQVRNNPRCKAAQQLQNGFLVLPNEATKLAPTPNTVALAKGDVYVVNNIIDKPEIRSKKDFRIENGEHLRAFNLTDLKGLPVELGANAVSTAYGSVSVGDKLVSDSNGSGKWIKADGTTIVATDYKVHLEVTEKTAFADQGFYGVIR